MSRSDFIQQRQQLSDSEKQQAAEDICQRLVVLPEFQHAQHIGLYHAIKGEVLTDPIFQAAMALNKNCYLPVITDYEKKHMMFHAYDNKTQWQKNKFGIDEPVVDNLKPVNGKTLQLLIVPVVAFNADNFRLGMGAGFYDRWISAQQKKPFCVGVAYDFQFCNDMRVERWDQPMDKVITPSRG